MYRCLFFLIWSGLASLCGESASEYPLLKESAQIRLDKTDGGADAKNSPRPVHDFDYYKLKIDLDVLSGQLSGTQMLSYRNDTKDPMNEVRLRLDPNMNSASGNNALIMEIDSVQNAAGQTLQWRYLPFTYGVLSSDRGQLVVQLAKPIAPGQTVGMKLTFRGIGKFVGREMIVLQDDPHHSLDAWYPKAMTRSGSEWSIDDDRPSTYDVSVVLPAGHTVVSTGVQIGREILSGENKSLQLHSEHARGFSIFSSPAWRKFNSNEGDIGLEVSLPAEAENWADPILKTMADVIRFYQQHYGEFPSRHLAMFCPGDLNGQAHGSSAACNVITVWLSKQFVTQYKWLIAHEVAHQYWGSLIGLNRKEIAWPLIGLGMQMDQQYSANGNYDYRPMKQTIDWFYYEAERRGFNTALSQPVENALKSPDRLWSNGWNMSLMHSKANFICSMLRDLLGEEKFTGIIKRIIREKAGSILTGNDFVRYCREASAEILDWFVHDWVDGIATLDYKVANVEKVEKGWNVKIVQLGSGAFPVWVEVQFESGKKLRQRVDHRMKETTFAFKTLGRPVLVTIDPDDIYPDVNRENNIWRSEN
jgi:hypothetical protein